MILKGNQRANGGDLAVHLMNEFDNERVHVAQVRGAVAADLKGAFAEFEAVAMGTKCTQPLYSLSINPSQPISRSQYEEAIEAIEQKLGLRLSPRAGRHAHSGLKGRKQAQSTARASGSAVIPRKVASSRKVNSKRFGRTVPFPVRPYIRYCFTRNTENKNTLDITTFSIHCSCHRCQSICLEMQRKTAQPTTPFKNNVTEV